MKQIINRLFHQMKQDSLRRKIAETERKKEFRTLETVQTMLVLWTPHEKEIVWWKKLEHTFPRVEKIGICFVSAGEEVVETGKTIYVKTEELKFGGKIVNERLQEALSREYDLLVDLSMVSSVMIDYVRKNAKAACKAGIFREDAEMDLLIEGADEPLDFIEKLHTVLSKFKKY